MAVLVKRRRLSNPSYSKLRRRGLHGTAQYRYKVKSKLGRGGYATKKRNPAKRMSLAQKLHFGTARQRAAARLSLSRKRNPSLKKLAGGGFNRKQRKAMVRANKAGELHGFGKRAQSLYYGQSHVARKNKRTKNIGEIVSISLAGLNPGRRKNTGMAKRRKRNSGTKVGRSWSTYKPRKRKSNPGVTRRRRRSATGVHRRRTRRSANPGYSRRRRNPVYAMRRINRGRRRNPGLGGVTSGTIGKALGVIGGMLGSKYITQLALGGNNTGVMGYGGNLVASIGLGWAATKVTKSKDFGMSVTIGGIAALVLRVISDNTSIGQYVNLSLAGVGKGGDTSLGIIQDSSFPVPQTFAPGSMTNAIVPRANRNYVSAQMAQAATMKAAGSGMGKMAGRGTRRAIM